MEEMIEKINNVLKFQMAFNWIKKSPYYGENNKYYKNSFVAHTQKHPIGERYKYGYGAKWNAIIDYSSYKTIFDSYYKISIELSQKFCLISKENYDIQYIKEHESVNIVNLNNGLIVCLKYNQYSNYFEIATCFFPYKINKLFSIKHKIFSENNKIEKDKDISELSFIPYKENNASKKININAFEEAMEEFFGANSIEYKILFNKKTNNNIVDIINNIASDVTGYLEFMESIIKNEEDKKYYFVFNDGIEYIAKWSLLYKIKDNNYKRLYQKFLNIDINNVYKNALDECKKYIDESEEKYGSNN